MTDPFERGPEARGPGTSGQGVTLTDDSVAVLAHELRCPLGAIRTALHVVRLARTADPAVEQAAGVIDRQMRHMGRLVDDLLDLARAKAGKLTLREEWTYLGTAVARAVETGRLLLEQRRHRLTVAVPPEPARLRADPARLQQILVNLLSNAAKYTDPGGHIRLTGEAADGRLTVRVRDDGQGIAPELLPRIFDPFYQAPGPDGRRRDGLGVGLALVKWLTELHGGTVAAASDGPGKGSEFVVRLPGAGGIAVRRAALTH